MASDTQPVGIISKSIAWSLHPTFADTDPLDWFAFLVIFILLGLFWSKVLRQLVDNP